jgi:hypothetical protein
MPSFANNESLLSALRKLKGEFIHDVPATIGLSAGAYQAPIDLLSLGQEDRDSTELYDLAEALLEDPAALRQLGDRVYELMEQDIRNQREQFGLFRS